MVKHGKIKQNVKQAHKTIGDVIRTFKNATLAGFLKASENVALTQLVLANKPQETADI